ncbi:2-hydroxyacid dehydrogenase [Roseovarius sp. MMSF_3281]|uniref:2-hydroxyacid dehydrogenase n=1 Tax=Roseovarius sp. MMSF_3281 TaxID=3046694 RepID=UPI00273E3366|nr:2-hydroxyacid dehydrogenase [Roseovarius sp. MMSF_3281]
MENLKVAAIGDQFITSSIFEAAIKAHINRPVEVKTRDLDWPEVPFFSHDGPAGTEIKEYSGNPADVAEILADADALVTHLAPVTETLLAGAPKLKFVGVPRGGPVNVNIEAAKKYGVTVCNLPGRNASAVAEFTIGMILANVRRIGAGHAGLKQGVWRGDLYRYDRTGDELSDLTVGLIGYSHIGQRVVRLLKPFGAKILICDPYVQVTVQDALDGVEQVDLNELLVRTDILSLHARLTPETKNMIGKEQIAKLREGAVIINSARGELIDQGALVDALSSGHLGGAALDTFESEPPAQDDEILALNNVTLTPHIAGASRRVANYAAEQIVLDYGRFLRGETPHNEFK